MNAVIIAMLIMVFFGIAAVAELINPIPVKRKCYDCFKGNHTGDNAGRCDCCNKRVTR